MVILNRGKLIASGSPRELKERVGTMKLVRTKMPDSRLRKYIVGLSDQYFILRVPENMNVEGDEVSREPATLEDVFVSLTDEVDSTTNRSRGGGGWRRWAS